MSLKRRKFMQETHLPKKRKLQSGFQPNSKERQRAYERTFIPLPQSQSDNESYLSEEDMDFFRDNIPSFLSSLDTKTIARRKKETMHLHKMFKSKSVVEQKLSFSGEDDFDSISLSENGIDTNTDTSLQNEKGLEQAYESLHRLTNTTQQGIVVPRLPIKMPSGRIVKTEDRLIPDQNQSNEDISKLSDTHSFPEPQPAEDVLLTAIPNTSSRQLLIQTAKEDIAQICQGILADPENSVCFVLLNLFTPDESKQLGLLRRLHSFTPFRVPSTSTAETVENDPLIRRLAMISQLAVLKDIIPDYRIRPLTDVEKNEKVSQAVLRMREWEQGLVSIYQTYLRSLETELKNNTAFAELALKSMCTLLTEATHFNFRSNIINAIVSTLSKKKWNDKSEICSQTLISVFKADKSGTPSLEIVRMISRMIKERHFMVHPNVLSCLLHVRLRSNPKEMEIGTERGHKYTSSNRIDRKRAKGKKVNPPYMTKKVRKIFKERKEIEKQLREADVEVDQEEWAKMQSETLKLLFGLYFRILKLPGWSPLLPSALEGISRHAHMVNIDFFKDLMDVLKVLVSQPQTPLTEKVSEGLILRYKLLCIVSAFELLTGQGEALSIDLKDFYTYLYNLIIPVSLEVLQGTENSAIDILFRGLSLAFPAHRKSARSPIRIAAFAKRLLSAFFLFPVSVVTRVLKFIEELISNEPRLLTLLSTDDRSINGLYKPDIDEPELCNPFATSLWELTYLATAHSHQEIGHKAQMILNSSV